MSSIESPKSEGEHERNDQDYVFIKIIARITLGVIQRFWILSSAYLVAIFVLYWYFGNVFAFLLFLLGLLRIGYGLCDHLLYHPEHPHSSRVFVPSPSTFQLSFSTPKIISDDGLELHAYYLTGARAPTSGTLLYFHGNAGNIGHRLLNAKQILQNLHLNVLLLEYRGYGLSQGTPSEKGLYSDAQAGLDYLFSRPDIDSSKIIVFGRSLGGAVAIDLCSRSENRDKIRLLIVENTFSSIPDLAISLFKWTQWIPVFLYKNKFSSSWKITKSVVPTLFILGEADSLIPSRMMVELYEACGSSSKKLVKFPGGTHNDTWNCSGYYTKIEEFIRENEGN